MYADQTLRLLSDLRDTPDPLLSTRILTKFFNYLKDGKTLLIQPRWLPVYPEINDPCLFHIMPFGPDWASKVTSVIRKTCKAANVEYIRGDEVDDPNVISSIWKEIARATYVLVDLTGLNANVALELVLLILLARRFLWSGKGIQKRISFNLSANFVSNVTT